MAATTKTRYYTEEGIEITERIDKRKTLFFTDIRKATANADQRRSYKYEVFDGVGSKSKLIGYAVPN